MEQLFDKLSIVHLFYGNGSKYYIILISQAQSYSIYENMNERCIEESIIRFNCAVLKLSPCDLIILLD